MKHRFLTITKWHALALIVIFFSTAFLFFHSKDFKVGPILAFGNTYYVDQNNPNCADSGSSAGSQNTPWCSIAPSVSKVTPGDTVLISDGRYGDFYSIITSGNSGNPITYRATGSNVVLGTFVDVVDEDFTAVEGFNNVYQIDLAPGVTIDSPVVSQTHFEQFDIFLTSFLGQTVGRFNNFLDSATTTSENKLSFCVGF